MCLAFPTSASQRQVAEQWYEVVPPQLITAVHAVRPGRYNILFFRNTVDQHIEETTDDDSVEEYDYVEKDCWEHIRCLSKYYSVAISAGVYSTLTAPFPSTVNFNE